MSDSSPNATIGDSVEWRSLRCAPEAGSQGRLNVQLSWVVVLAGGAVVLAHFGLISGGAWGGDEYMNFSTWRAKGVGGLIWRMLGWSPRPSSEILLYLYAVAVNALHKPLITPFLAAMWLALIGSAIFAIRRPIKPNALGRGAVLASVLALFLLGHQISAVFYWPMGAAAYMLALLGIVVLTFQTIGADAFGPRRRLACATALAIIGTSSEIGMFFVIGYTGCLILFDLRDVRRNGLSPLRLSAWYLLPLAVTLAMLAIIVNVVLTTPARGFGEDSPYFHRLGASAAATFRFFFLQFGVGDNTPRGLAPTQSLIANVLMSVGFLWGTRSALWGRFRPRLVMALLSGLLACWGLGLFASYYEYGTQEHEPHIAFRRCLSVLILLVAARLAGGWWQTRLPALHVLGPAALLGAIVIGSIPRYQAVVEGYQTVPIIRAARDATWESGLDPAGDTLEMHIAAPGWVLGGTVPFPPGVFVLGAPDTPWWMTGIMTFFNKRKIQFTLVQTGRS